MPYTPRAPVPLPAPPSTTRWTVRQRHAVHAPIAPPRPTRRVTLQWLDENGQMQDAVRRAPVGDIFDTMFSAFARGTLVPTVSGPVAIEDLLPGDIIETADGAMPLKWIGGTTLLPNTSDPVAPPLGLFRIAADALGLGRPMPDLMLGTGARILNRMGTVHEEHGAPGVLQRVRRLEDGESVVALNPVSPVQLFHLAFDSHRTFLANGVEVESMHPGPMTQTGLDANEMPLLRGLLPHIRGIEDLGGLRFPRQDVGREHPTVV